MLSTDLTVSAVVEQDDHYLIVRERASGLIVLNQPGGHIEAGESPEQAVAREALEEAGCRIDVRELLGVYLWIHPQTRQNFLRIAYVADLLEQDNSRSLDDVVQSVHWYNRADLEQRATPLRSPLVMRVIDDYEAGSRQPGSLIEGCMPVQQNVQQVMANASLV